MPHATDGTAQVEGIKLAYDYLKHMTTLGTGAVVILATFASKFESVKGGSHARQALVGFLISIAGAMIAASIYAVRDRHHRMIPPPGGWITWATLLWASSTIAFIYSLVKLALFASANIP